MDKFQNTVLHPNKNLDNFHKNIFLKVKNGSHNGVVLNADITQEIVDEFLFFNYFLQGNNC